MPYLLSILLVFLSGSLCAQSFTEVFQPALFDLAGSPKTAVADVDGDGDQDLVLTGIKCTGERIAKLYINEGGLHFRHEPNSFISMIDGVLDFADIDMDGDQDLIIGGREGSLDEGPTTYLYQNDGTGDFSIIEEASFPGIVDGSILFQDIDGDGDQDLLLTGGYRFTEFDPITKLYKNDGIGGFTEVSDIPMPALYNSTAAFSDFNGDGVEDLLLFGIDTLDEWVRKLYANDGLGNFSVLNDEVWEDLTLGSLSISDVDSDGDMDFLAVGQTDAAIYLNDGSGKFIKSMDSVFQGASSASSKFFDMAEDGDEDVIVIGQRSGVNFSTNIYMNDGQGKFTEVDQNFVDGMDGAAIEAFDADLDGDLDLFITGRKKQWDNLANIFVNDGAGNFSSDPKFEPLEYGDIDYADIDNDGDQDVLIGARKCFNAPISVLYENDSQGQLTEIKDTPFVGVEYSAIAFEDVDNDGDEDVLLTGRSGNNQVTASLYKNDGNGVFTKDFESFLIGVMHGAVSFGDVDNDGDQDLLISGQRASGDGRSTTLYENDGQGKFTEVVGTPFIGVGFASNALLDINGDGDLDVFVMGQKSNFNNTAKIYLKDWDGSYFELTGLPFTASLRDAEFADFDGDGDQDLLIVDAYETEFFFNNGFGDFTKKEENIIEGMYRSSLEISDYDNDGDMDVLITGSNEDLDSLVVPRTDLYINNGLAQFSKVEDLGVIGVANGNALFFDANGDEGKDLIIIGADEQHTATTRLYINVNEYSYVQAGKTEDGEELLVCPNLINEGHIKISVHYKDVHEFELGVTNLSGQLLFKQSPSIHQLSARQVDVSQLPTGIYFVHLTKEDKKLVAKFVVI